MATSEQLERVRETESRAYGMVINSFEELEKEYVKEFKKLKGGKVWCLGPLSLSNDNDIGESLRGHGVDDQRYVKWLDSKEHGSVVYACFGSSSRVTPPQLIELGLALEASKSPFIWVIRAGDRANEIESWLSESGFENRIKDRGLVIRGWVPQLLILSHPSVGGFLTHCGWNSILEGVSVGAPSIDGIYIKNYINILRLGYEKPTAFALCASRLNFRPRRFCAPLAF
ncbi:putative trans-zeatin O-beta-D-glucosyltransferase [Helianthus debilis subsp. tardiflorus]